MRLQGPNFGLEKAQVLVPPAARARTGLGPHARRRELAAESSGTANQPGAAYNGAVQDIPSRLTRVLQVTSYPGLRLLVLFGSRARGDASRTGDWDFGYLAGPEFDPDRLLADLAGALATDRIDLVDLARAGGQLRFRAARDGRVLYEPQPGAFGRFWMEAVSFWCDAAPVLEHAYAGVLARLDR